MRFLRRDGDRLFLDSRDLIQLIEAADPLSIDHFAKLLSSRNARVVLAFTNVAELVPQTPAKPPDRRRVRNLMDQLERLPHAYLRTPELGRAEFERALHAFERSIPIAQFDPYVEHWWETFWEVPPSIVCHIEPRAQIEYRNRLSLADQVELLLHNRQCLAVGERHEAELQNVVSEDRARLKTLRGSRKTFIAAVTTELLRYGRPEPSGGVERFADFIRSRTDVCPGWRISHDVYEEYRCNLTAVPQTNDIPDLSHVQILPYVSHATLDRAWRTRCRQARDRLAKDGLRFSAYDRVYPDLAAILDTWQRAG